MCVISRQFRITKLFRIGSAAVMRHFAVASVSSSMQVILESRATIKNSKDQMPRLQVQ